MKTNGQRILETLARHGGCLRVIESEEINESIDRRKTLNKEDTTMITCLDGVCIGWFPDDIKNKQ